MFAPYKVATFDEILRPSRTRTAWVNDYGGYMSIGYDADKVPAPTSVEDLLGPEYKGKVALNGDPTKAGAAFAGVQMVSVSQGGTVEDISKGVDFFAKLKDAGNFLRRPDARHDRVRPDAGCHRLGLPQRRPGREAARQHP